MRTPGPPTIKKMVGMTRFFYAFFYATPVLPSIAGSGDRTRMSTVAVFVCVFYTHLLVDACGLIWGVLQGSTFVPLICSLMFRYAQWTGGNAPLANDIKQMARPLNDV